MIVSIKRRRLIIRITLVVVWIGLGALLFITNRGHRLLIDNANVAELGLRAPDVIMVTLDKQKPVEFLRGDRDIFRVGGSRHWIHVEFNDGRPPFQTWFNLPLGPDMFLLSIPKMISGTEPFFEVFYTRQESRSADESDVHPGEI